MPADTYRRRSEDWDPLCCGGDAVLNRLCEAWAAWCHAESLPGLATPPAGPLRRLAEHPRRRSTDAEQIDVVRLRALHLAILGQPPTALDRRVFELHYLWGIRSIKTASAELHISRGHWYRLVRCFRARVHAAARDIEAALAQAQ